jgi:ABC-type transporter Mla MlaB component
VSEVIQAAEVSRDSDTQLALSGDLTFETVGALWKTLLATPIAQKTVVDLALARATDSAGVALLIAWRARQLRTAAPICFKNIPKRLLDLARLTDAEEVLAGVGS